MQVDMKVLPDCLSREASPLLVSYNEAKQNECEEKMKSL